MGLRDLNSSQKKLLVGILVGLPFFVAAVSVWQIGGKGDSWEDKCREATERQYGYAADWQEEEIETCAQTAKDWEKDGVSQEEIYRQWGLL